MLMGTHKEPHIKGLHVANPAFIMLIIYVGWLREGWGRDGGWYLATMTTVTAN